MAARFARQQALWHRDTGLSERGLDMLLRLRGCVDWGHDCVRCFRTGKYEPGTILGCTYCFGWWISTLLELLEYGRDGLDAGQAVTPAGQKSASCPCVTGCPGLSRFLNIIMHLHLRIPLPWREKSTATGHQFAQCDCSH